jgi:hypothetical protein
VQVVVVVLHGFSMEDPKPKAIRTPPAPSVIYTWLQVVVVVIPAVHSTPPTQVPKTPQHPKVAPLVGRQMVVTSMVLVVLDINMKVGAIISTFEISVVMVGIYLPKEGWVALTMRGTPQTKVGYSMNTRRVDLVVVVLLVAHMVVVVVDMLVVKRRVTRAITSTPLDHGLRVVHHTHRAIRTEVSKVIAILPMVKL